MDSTVYNECLQLFSNITGERTVFKDPALAIVGVEEEDPRIAVVVRAV